MKYKSCVWLERGITFSKDAVKVCCVSLPRRMGNPDILTDYKGELIDWERFFTLKNRIKELHKQGGTFYKCEGCVFLQEKEWPEFGDHIDTINIDHWSKCNSRCIYCYTMEDKEFYNGEKIYDIFPVIKDMLDKRIFTRLDHVNFGGGEVTLLKEFDELLNLFLPYCDNSAPILIHSSGVQYSKSIEKGLNAGSLKIIISPDCATEKTHKRIKQVETYNHVWKNLEKYASAQVRNDLVKAKYIILPGINDNKKEIEKFINKNKQIGVKTVIIEIEGIWFSYNFMHVPKFMYELIDFAREKAQENGLNFELYDRARSIMQNRNK